MTVALFAAHYPKQERFDVFVQRVHRAAEHMRATPGCRTAQCWLTAAGDAVVGIAEWDDDDARLASFAAARAGGVDFDDHDDEVRPRTIFWLTSLN